MGLYEDLKSKEPFSLSTHWDADGLFSAEILRRIFKVKEPIQIPEFGVYKTDVALDLGAPIAQDWAGILIDHHPQDTVIDRKYKLYWDYCPTGRILYNHLKQYIDPKDTWLVCGSLAGDGQAELTPDEIWDAFPVLFQGRGILYQSQFKLGISDNPLYVFLSSGVNAMCLVKGTKIFLKDCGVNAIDNINIGDIVLTHDNNYKEVINIMNRKYNGKLYSIYKLGSNIPIEITEEHSLLVIKVNKCKTRNTFCHINGCPDKNMRKDGCKHYYNTYKLEWVKAKNVSIGDYVVTPIINTNDKETYTYSFNYGIGNQRGIKYEHITITLPVNNELLELIGYFLSEGSIRTQEDRYDVSFSLNKNEVLFSDRIQELVKNIFNIEPSDICVYNNVRIIRYYKKHINEFFKQFGYGATNKFIPLWIKELSPEKLKFLIKGEWIGDGNKFPSEQGRKIEHGIRITTYSETLAWDIYQILAKLKWMPRIYKENNPKCRKKLSINPAFSVDFKLTDNICDFLGVKFILPSRRIELDYISDDGKYLLSPISKIEVDDVVDVDVYNLDVKDDNSYVANGIIVHNCRLGFPEQALEVLRICKTPVDLLENDGIRDAVRSMRSEEEAVYKSKPIVESYGNLVLVRIKTSRPQIRLCGLIASKLHGSNYNKTFIVFNELTGEGSIRGTLAKYYANKLTVAGFKAGGHAAHCGLSIPEEKIQEFYAVLRMIVR